MKREYVSEKSNTGAKFQFTNIRTRCSDKVDRYGYIPYRSVFRTEEAKDLYVDIEWINNFANKKSWVAEGVIKLLCLKDQETSMVECSDFKIDIIEGQERVTLEHKFFEKEEKQKKIEEGIYRVEVVIDGVSALSDDIFIVKSYEHWYQYISLADIGFDRCEEYEKEERALRSYRELNIKKLKDVRLYFVAYNLLSYPWVYEMKIYIEDESGEMVAGRIVKNNNFITTPEGENLLFFVVNIEGEVERRQLWKKGRYKISISIFDQQIIALYLIIGDKDVPHQFSSEIATTMAEAVEHPLKEDTPQTKEENRDSPRSRFYQLVGLRRVKEEITRLFEITEFVGLRRANGFTDKYPSLNMFFLGNPGTGKSTVASIIGEEFARLGALQNGRVYKYRKEDLFKPGVMVEEQLIREAIKKASGGILYIEDADELLPTNNPGDPSLRILNALMFILQNENPTISVILGGDVTQLDLIYENYPEIKNLFSIRLIFDDYSVEELMHIAQQKLAQQQYKLAPEAEDKFFKLLKSLDFKGDGNYMNGDFVEEQIKETTSRMAKRIISNYSKNYTKEEMMLIKADDVAEVDTPDPGKSLDKFGEMIGSGELKRSLMGYINYVYFLYERHKHGLTEPYPPLNMVFAGNPGTGKATVAKMIAEMLESLNLLEAPVVQIREYGDLVGDGTYPPQQFALYAFEQARGGILYIRESQNLFRDANGAAALGTILGQLSETHDDTIVILGGSVEELEKFFINNPKLKLIFPYFFHFEDYKTDELYEIALQKIKEKKYELHPKAGEKLRKLIEQICSGKQIYFGNALLINKLIDQSIKNLSERTMKIREKRELTRKEVITLMAADIPVSKEEVPDAYKEYFDEKEIDAALKELDHMVGQKRLKKQIHDFVNLAKHYQEQGIKLTTRMSLQWYFTGNSGMGKGTVARIIARIYKAMGLIDKASVSRFKAEKLINLNEEDIAGTIGSALLQSQGGIFFFDEDSSRLSEIHGLQNRLRAILINQMAEKPGSYTIIYANQNPPRQLVSDEVEKISDMVNILYFEDYSKEELMEILKRDIASEQYKMTPQAQRYMADFIEQMLDNKKYHKISARLIKLMAELMIRNRIQRLSRRGEKHEEGKVLSITKEDVREFTPEFLATLTNTRPTIGF